MVADFRRSASPSHIFLIHFQSTGQNKTTMARIHCSQIEQRKMNETTNSMHKISHIRTHINHNRMICCGSSFRPISAICELFNMLCDNKGYKPLCCPLFWFVFFLRSERKKNYTEKCSNWFFDCNFTSVDVKIERIDGEHGNGRIRFQATLSRLTFLLAFRRDFLSSLSTQMIFVCSLFNSLTDFERVNSKLFEVFFFCSSSSSNCHCICVPNVCLHICCCRKWIIVAIVCVWVTHLRCANIIVPAERHSNFENGDDISQLVFTACAAAWFVSSAGIQIKCDS